jgi:hypothetical protein
MQLLLLHLRDVLLGCCAAWRSQHSFDNLWQACYIEYSLSIAKSVGSADASQHARAAAWIAGKAAHICNNLMDTENDHIMSMQAGTSVRHGCSP